MYPSGTTSIPDESDVGDPFPMCSGWNYTHMDELTHRQAQRLNSLNRRIGNLSLCQHDLTYCVLTAELLEGDGDYKGNPLYTGSINTPPTMGLLGLGP